MAKILNYDYLLREIGRYAKKAGRAVTKPLLLLYYVMVGKDTPMKDKLMLASAIAYVVLPIDLLSAKRLPFIGWIDEVVSLTVAIEKVQKNITPEMHHKADALLDKWFPDYASYAEV